MASPNSAVLLTGASGFIASHILQQLLDLGYTVHATVRDAANPDKTNHLRQIAEKSGIDVNSPDSRLKFFSADLTGGEGVFDAAIDGCETVIHTATPVSLGGPNGETEVFNPGMAGMREILAAVKKTLGGSTPVKQFVLTSSMSAIAPVPEPEIKTEEHWSDPDAQKEGGRWYGACKTCQEKLLWEMAQKGGELESVRCVTICPTAVVGPMLQPTMNMTNGWWIGMFKDGKERVGGRGIWIPVVPGGFVCSSLGRRRATTPLRPTSVGPTSVGR